MPFQHYHHVSACVSVFVCIEREKVREKDKDKEGWGERNKISLSAEKKRICLTEQ